LQVSIDAPDESHDEIRGRSGSFNKALDFFEFAKNNCNSKNLVIATTLMKHNYKKIFGMFELCSKLKPSTFCVIPIMPSGKATKDDDISVELKKEIFDHLIDEWLMKYQNNFDLSLIIPKGLIPQRFQNTRHGGGYLCSFPHMLGIDSNGNVAPCDGLLDNSEFILGNIRIDSLKKIVNHPSYIKLKNIGETEFEGVCKICKFLPDCQGGCRVEAYNRYRRFTAPDPICQSFYEKGLFPKENLRC